MTEKFLQAVLAGVGPEGAVYASMGTLCNFGPEEFVAIGQALSALPNLVIWKLAHGDLPGKRHSGHSESWQQRQSAAHLLLPDRLK